MVEQDNGEKDIPQMNDQMDGDDWFDIMESEFVDFVEGRRSVGFVFDHDEIGLHGFKFDKATKLLEPVSFEKSEDGGGA